MFLLQFSNLGSHKRQVSLKLSNSVLQHLLERVGCGLYKLGQYSCIGSVEVGSEGMGGLHVCHEVVKKLRVVLQSVHQVIDILLTNRAAL